MLRKETRNLTLKVQVVIRFLTILERKLIRYQVPEY